MRARLVITIIDTLLDEAAIVFMWLWVLPKFEIRLPLGGLVVLMVAWVAYTVFTYRLGSRALRRKQVVGLTSMVGSKGEVVSPLAPEGMVKIKGELWIAKSASGVMETGEEIIVVGQERLKLVVQGSSTTGDLEETK